MKFIYFVLIYLVVYLPVGILSYILIEDHLFWAFNSLVMLIWLVVFTYIDRILLIFLGAREVIDTDEHLFFQILKNNAYKNRVNLPKVYLYNGNIENCFLLESFKSWTIVLDKNLLKNLSEESLEKVVEFFYRYHLHEGRGFLKTKAMGVCVLFYMTIYWFLKNIFFQKTKSKVYKAVTTFVVIMSRPFLFPFEFILRSNSRVPVDISLQQYSLRVKNQEVFTEYILGLIIENKRFKELIISYMEGYPIFMECEYQHEF